MEILISSHYVLASIKQFLAIFLTSSALVFAICQRCTITVRAYHFPMLIAIESPLQVHFVASYFCCFAKQFCLSLSSFIYFSAFLLLQVFPLEIHFVSQYYLLSFLLRLIVSIINFLLKNKFCELVLSCCHKWFFLQQLSAAYRLTTSMQRRERRFAKSTLQNNPSSSLAHHCLSVQQGRSSTFFSFNLQTDPFRLANASQQH